MRPLPILILAASAACGDPPVRSALTLAPQYDAVGVVRVFPDGLSPVSLETFAMSFGSVRQSAGRALAQVQRKGIGATPIELSGTFEEDAGDLQFDPARGALTSTRTESIGIAGTAEDGFPEDDGVADHVTGFIRTEIDLELREGQFLAVSPHDLRPPPIEESLVTAVDRMNGMIELRGAPGAALPSVGVEVLRFTVAREDPDFRVIEAEPDGSFTILMTGLGGDVFLLRNAPAGRRSDARVIRPG
jgi:hypothetical protein